MRKKFLNLLNKIDKGLIFITLTLTITTLPNIAYADDPKLVTGSLALANAITNWILILIPVAASAKLGYHALKKMLADNDQAIITEQNRLMKNVLITAVIAESATSIVKLVLSFYR